MIQGMDYSYSVYVPVFKVPVFTVSCSEVQNHMYMMEYICMYP